jgi:S-methylmethionine-dependent homocysteine/selenocysteine methylase
MSFSETLQEASFILTEGAVIERLRRSPSLPLHPRVLNTALLFEAEGPNALRRIYREYLHVGFHHDLPMLILTPTWRANPERCAAAGLPGVGAVSEEAFRLLDQVRDGYGAYAKNIFIGGLMGCRGDAYRSGDALPEEEARKFHEAQVRALAATGVDFLLASTLPALSEARGIARAMGEHALPGLLSFIVRPGGRLLDGTPLDEAIRSIDESVDRAPAGYLINCVHPSVYEEAMNAAIARDPMITTRLLGLQANTSSKSPEELNGSSQLECEDPELFATQMMHLRLEFGIRVMGGCCGTDARHIFALARRARELFSSAPQVREKKR